MSANRIFHWIQINEIKLYVATAVIGFIFAMLFGNAYQWEHKDKSEQYAAFFDSIDKRLVFIGFDTWDNSMHFVLAFNGERLSDEDIKSIVPRFKPLLVDRICNEQMFMDELQSGHFLNIDLRDESAKSRLKNHFNLIIKSERCLE